MIRVVIADDHDLLREGVTACLASTAEIEVVGEASTGEAALELVADLRPDVVVIDMVMPGIGGLEAIRRLRAADDRLGIVALTSFFERSRIQEALDAGANGYLVKSVDTDSLVHAVRNVSLGHDTFSPEVTRALAQRPTTPDGALDMLTARETEIADLVAEGRTNAEIANELSLSIFTVKNHVSNILSKLHAQTRTEAAAMILTARRGAMAEAVAD
ncbi:LuxR family two component transcriptional regulator [Ilumatobacter fluminis]|uniref:LuxR family two component transcriptional regulator n=1 Tax=Ilumatobacter fluminis TaxID=467091 RepID=A0A4R7I3D0_9ACTN|nr:response regulator transcription factor [Ilumatobacter fluminis]TDT18137.1 LuxR family two component transcriptional regulator [Ilumatobacter fluminis]